MGNAQMQSFKRKKDNYYYHVRIHKNGTTYNDFFIAKNLISTSDRNITNTHPCYHWTPKTTEGVLVLTEHKAYVKLCFSNLQKRPKYASFTSDLDLLQRSCHDLCNGYEIVVLGKNNDSHTLLRKLPNNRKRRKLVALVSSPSPSFMPAANLVSNPPNSNPNSQTLGVVSVEEKEDSDSSCCDSDSECKDEPTDYHINRRVVDESDSSSEDEIEPPL